MKKLLIIFAVFYTCKSIYAQKSLDTIYANEYKNVAVFFPKPIRQATTGSPNFVFTYNREKEQYFGLLQAEEGKESNLLAITNDGEVYSYILKYKKELPQLNYFVGLRESIGNEVRKAIKDKPSIPPISEAIKLEKFNRSFSKYLLRLTPDPITTKRKKGLKLQLQKMVYQGNQVYLVLEFKNNSGIDFEIDYLKAYRVNGNKKRKASYQKLEQQIIYSYEFPEIVKTNTKKRFVCVLPKFVLGAREKLEIELKELNGNRKMQIKF